jgi:uncharacterized protein (TIGR03437 family)
MNSATMTSDLSPGVLASLFGENLTPVAAAKGVARDNSPRQTDAVRVTFNGQAATLLAVSSRQINLQIPAVEPGSAELRVYAGESVSEPMLVRIGRVSPGVFGAMRVDDSFVQSSNPARRGETLALLATGLGRAVSILPEESALTGALRPPIQIQVEQARLLPEAIEPAGGIPGLYRIRFSLPESVSGAIKVSLLVDGRRSNVIELPVGR